jgi:hypothetical protein
MCREPLFDMTKRSSDVGRAFDNYVRDRQRLAITHIVLGAIAAFVYFLRPATFHPLDLPRGYAELVAMVTLIAWLPYLLSWLVVRETLPGKGRAATAFIAFAALISVTGDALLLDLIPPIRPVPPIFTSVGVTALLVLAARVAER